jgi:hypothetical protein
MVLSHQALPRKAQLVSTILDTLVAPCAQHFKPQLAQLAQLPTVPPLQHLVQRAQQLLDHAFLSDLSAAIAISLVTPPEGVCSEVELSMSGIGMSRSGSGSKDREGMQTSELDKDNKPTQVRLQLCCRCCVDDAFLYMQASQICRVCNFWHDV